jgi:hypothetical protein
VKVLRNLLSEPLVQLLVGVEHETVALRSFLASGHERRVFVTFEQTRNFGVGQKGVHALEETRVENIGLVHDETDLLALASRSTEHIPKVLIEVFSSVLVGDLDLEDTEAVHPGHEARQRGL